jgi:hypothetical protein
MWRQEAFGEWYNGDDISAGVSPPVIRRSVSSGVSRVKGTYTHGVQLASAPHRRGVRPQVRSRTCCLSPVQPFSSHASSDVCCGCGGASPLKAHVPCTPTSTHTPCTCTPHRWPGAAPPACSLGPRPPPRWCPQPGPGAAGWWGHAATGWRQRLATESRRASCDKRRRWRRGRSTRRVHFSGRRASAARGLSF